MLTKREKEEIEQLEKLRSHLRMVKQAIGPFDGVVTGIPVIAIRYKGMWAARDVMFNQLGRFESMIDQTVKDVDREIGKLYGRGEREESVLVTVPKANGTR